MSSLQKKPSDTENMFSDAFSNRSRTKEEALKHIEDIKEGVYLTSSNRENRKKRMEQIIENVIFKNPRFVR